MISSTASLIKLKWPITALILSLLPLLAYSQDFNQYKPLQSRWSIPADFTGRASQKYYKDLASIDSKESRFNKRSKKDFYLESNFGIGDFLTSGRVLFNDQASAYLSEIMDVLLKDDQALRKQIRIYVVKSPAVNAFTTNNGIIFVTMGLLSRLENEAQLAWVLSHEVVHYREQHVIDSYVKGQEIKKSKGMYKKLSLKEQDYAKSSFNREQEMKSDSEGLKIFLKSGYNKREAIKVFDILAQAHLPQEEKSLNLDFFESKHFKIPAKLKLDSIAKRKEHDDYDDSRSSHPTLKKRKQVALQTLIDAGAIVSGKPFLVSATDFEKIRNIATFEVLREQLITGDYIEAFYQAYLILEQYPESEYVQSAMGKALYGIAKWGANGSISSYEGNIQRFAHLANRQQSMEQLVLALRYLYPLQLKYPQNEEIRLMVRDLLVEMALKDRNAEKRFARQGQPPAEGFQMEDWGYLHAAFTDFADEGAFYTLFDDIMGRVRAYEKEVEERKNKEVNKDKPQVNKVLVVQPIYQKVDKRKKKSLRHEDSEDILIAIDERIEKAADRLKMDVSIINTNTISSKEVALFNNHSIVQDWLREKLQHDAPDGISPIHNELQEVMQAHGTDYLLWMGGMALTERNRGFLTYGLLSFVSPVFIPAAMYKVFVPKKHTFFFAFTFDTRRESLIANDVRLMKLKDNRAVMQSNIYYTLFKLKHP